jgi:hypothetical protein
MPDVRRMAGFTERGAASDRFKAMPGPPQDLPSRRPSADEEGERFVLDITEGTPLR